MDRRKEIRNNTKLRNIILYSLVIVVLLLAYGSAIHSIDLSWNAVRIDGLVDDNGIITQTPEQMHSRGVMYVMWFPLLILIPIAGIFYETRRE